MGYCKFSNEFAHLFRLAILIRLAPYPYGNAGRERMLIGSFKIRGNWLCIRRQ